MRNFYKDTFPQTFPKSTHCQFCGDILQEKTQKHNTLSIFF